jgi:hypothetical protein
MGKSYDVTEDNMADREREIIHTNGGGMGGMGAILGLILGVLLVGGLIFFFAGDWDRGTTTTGMNPPATTGSAPSRPAEPPAAPANPAR